MLKQYVARDCLEPKTANFYLRAMEALRASDVPFLIGGAYAFGHYTGIVRHTKDLDLFVRPADGDRVLTVLASAGYRTEKTFAHWLGKAFCGADFVDVIYCSGNGVCAVDEEWFSHSVKGEVLGSPADLCPAEEMIWQKAFVMERERFDGADIMHLIRARSSRMDWDRLLRRFGPHWRALLSHLVMFGFVYPAERTKVPAIVLADLARRLTDETSDAPGALCQGTLLSRLQYLSDTELWGYDDPRLQPRGSLSREDITHWTAAAFEQK